MLRDDSDGGVIINNNDNDNNNKTVPQMRYRTHFSTGAQLRRRRTSERCESAASHIGNVGFCKTRVRFLAQIRRLAAGLKFQQAGPLSRCQEGGGSWLLSTRTRSSYRVQDKMIEKTSGVSTELQLRSMCLFDVNTQSMLHAEDDHEGCVRFTTKFRGSSFF